MPSDHKIIQDLNRVEDDAIDWLNELPEEDVNDEHNKEAGGATCQDIIKSAESSLSTIRKVIVILDEDEKLLQLLEKKIIERFGAL